MNLYQEQPEEMISADELKIICGNQQTTILVTNEKITLTDYADDYHHGQFKLLREKLSLISDGDDLHDEQHAVALNIPVKAIESQDVLNMAKTWWFLRLSESLVVIKPIRSREEFKIERR